MSEWISVKERLPKHKDRVGYVFDGENIRTDVYYSEKHWQYTNILDYEVKLIGVITHWMLRPEKPKD